MVTASERLEYALSGLDIADHWKKEGNILREESCVSDALMDYLAALVLDCDGIDDVRAAWSEDPRVSDTLLRHHRLLGEVVAKVDAGEVPNSVIAGNYPHLVFAHLAWALGEIEIGETYAKVASRDDVLDLSTPFWREYSRAVGCLVECQPYAMSDFKSKGQEKYWLSYLRLIECATNHNDLEPTISEINDTFARRNADKTITDDAYEVEGSGLQPVRWDFRRDGLLSYIDQKQ